MGRAIVLGAEILALLLCGACQRSAQAMTETGHVRRGGAAAGGSGPAAARPPAMSSTSIDDPALGGMAAITLKVPSGWRSEGTILHAECDLTPIAAFRANTPDGATGVQLFPRFDTSWSDQPGGGQAGPCRFAAPQSPEEFVRTVLIPQARPGAEIVSVGVDPDDRTAQQVATANAGAAAQQEAANRMFGANAPTPRFSGRSARIRIRYPAGGRTLQEDLDVSVVSQESAVPGFPAMGGPASIRMIKTQTTVVGTRAPAGTLDAAHPVFAAIAGSLKVNPAWHQAALEQVRQYLARSDQQNRERANAMTSRTIANIHAIGQASMAAAARSEAARHAGAQAFIQHMGDRETVMDPSTGRTAEMSNQYNHSYYDQRSGTALQTDSAYNPGANWTELQVVPPR